MKTENELSEKQLKEQPEIAQLQQDYLHSLRSLLSDQHVIIDDSEPEKRNKFYLLIVVLLVVVIGLFIYQNIRKQ